MAATLAGSGPEGDCGLVFLLCLLFIDWLKHAGCGAEEAKNQRPLGPGEKHYSVPQALLPAHCPSRKIFVNVGKDFQRGVERFFILWMQPYLA